MDASVLVTLYLREMGVRRIITKAVSPDHGKVLRLVGATEVVLPERDTALRVASALGTHGVLEYLPLGPGFSLIELAAPERFVGKTLAELEIRRQFHVLVVAVKNGDRLDLVPGAGYRIQKGDLLMLIGSDQDLALVTPDAR
jgi:trk system potassium uptake protein TrkA